MKLKLKAHVAAATPQMFDIQALIQTLSAKLGAKALRGNPPYHSDYSFNPQPSPEQLDSVLRQVMEEFHLKAQDPQWMPGTPTGEEADTGYYICPINDGEWEGGHFDMMVIVSGLTYC